MTSLPDRACRPLERCVACGASGLERYLDLGRQPLANSFATSTRDLPRFPLGVALCSGCWHSQLTHAVEPELLFRNYLYVSGTTVTLTDYFARFALEITERHGRALDVIDIASNDGSFLEACLRHGHRVHGVDPAENLAPLARQRGVPTRVAYWSSDVARAMAPADVIVAMNVIAHVSDPCAFLRACALALKPGGTLYLQTSQANMFRNWEFDTVYHEHHSYFTTRSMRALAARAGFSLRDVSMVPVHGGSYRWVLQVGGDSPPLLRETEEAGEGFYDIATYRRFQVEAERIADRVRRRVDELRAEGWRVAAYGAAAKGNTFVNFAGVTPDFMVDDNPMKCGLRSPGMDAPVVPASHLADAGERLALIILAWNFWDEVSRRVGRARGARATRLIRAFPAWQETDVTPGA